MILTPNTRGQDHGTTARVIFFFGETFAAWPHGRPVYIMLIGVAKWHLSIVRRVRCSPLFVIEGQKRHLAPQECWRRSAPRRSSPRCQCCTARRRASATAGRACRGSSSRCATSRSWPRWRVPQHGQSAVLAVPQLVFFVPAQGTPGGSKRSTTAAGARASHLRSGSFARL